MLKKFVSVAVCCGLLLSSSASAFEGARAQAARDVELSGAGHLSGTVCTPEGIPVSGKAVTLKYQGAVVAETTSGANGDFAFSGVRGGVHELSVGSSSTPLRLWKHGSAPAGAGRQVAVAVGEPIVRGQNGFVSPAAFAPGYGFMTGVAIVATGAAITGLVVAADAKNDLDDLRDSLASP
jgi:hypothetical protein